MNKKARIIALLAFFPITAFSATVEQAFVDEQDGHYLINLVMQVETPKAEIIQVLTNYAQIHELSKSIISSKVIEHTSESAKVELISEGCIFLFCKTITQVQTAKRMGSDYIIVNVEPLTDNIKSSVQYWRFKPLGNSKTLVTYSADIEPDFWVPAFLGSWLFQQRLLEEATEIITNAETIANYQSH